MTRSALALQIPRNPKKTCELQCHLSCHTCTLPVSGPGWMLSLWEDEGCTLPGESPKVNLKFLVLHRYMYFDAIVAREQ